MGAGFDRDQLLDAFDQIAEAAIAAGTRLDIAVFGGSALILASNFRFTTEDVDIAELSEPWPNWLTECVARLADQNGWSDSWLNDAIAFHLSAHAQAARDLVCWGTFPRSLEQIGLTVFVPTAEYLFALKLKASRVSDFVKGKQDLEDITNLMRVLEVTDVEEAIILLAKYFPTSAAHADKERFVVKYLLSQEISGNAPCYPQRGL
jgi:hypothetical protein